MSGERLRRTTQNTGEVEMTNELQNTIVRELSAEELVAVSGGKQVCSYEAANRCYVWRDQTFWEVMMDIVNSYK
jgi:hypothetical protein